MVLVRLTLEHKTHLFKLLYVAGQFINRGRGVLPYIDYIGRYVPRDREWVLRLSVLNRVSFDNVFLA